MSVEVSGEMVADLMSDDPNFALEIWQTLAEHIQAGAMRDDAADLCSGLEAGHATFLANTFRELSEAMRYGFNMAHPETQI
jgi:hypothetical protein